MEIRKNMKRIDCFKQMLSIISSRIKTLETRREGLKNQRYYKKVIEIKPVSEDELNIRLNLIRSRVNKLKKLHTFVKDELKNAL